MLQCCRKIDVKSNAIKTISQICKRPKKSNIPGKLFYPIKLNFSFWEIKIVIESLLITDPKKLVRKCLKSQKYEYLESIFLGGGFLNDKFS